MHIRLFLFISIILLYSCKNEKKELYFLEIKATLISELDWISGKIENEYRMIDGYYINEWKPQRITSLVNQSYEIYNQFKITQNNTIKNPETSLIDQINSRTQSMDSAYQYYIELKKISDEILKKEGIRTYHSSNYKIILVPEKTILSPNEPLIAKLMFCETNNFHPDVHLKAFINNTEVSLINNKAEYIIPGDSTKNMRPGKYEWNGKIILTLNNKDSIYSFEESFIITPPICE